MSPIAGIGHSLGQASIVRLARAVTAAMDRTAGLIAIGAIHHKFQLTNISNRNLMSQEGQVTMICGEVLGADAQPTQRWNGFIFLHSIIMLHCQAIRGRSGEMVNVGLCIKGSKHGLWRLRFARRQITLYAETVLFGASKMEIL